MQGECAAETSADFENLWQRKKLSSFCMGPNSARNAPLVDSDSESFFYGVNSLAKVRLIQRFFFNFMSVTPTRPVYLCLLAFFCLFYLLTCVCVCACVFVCMAGCAMCGWMCARGRMSCVSLLKWESEREGESLHTLAALTHTQYSQTHTHTHTHTHTITHIEAQDKFCVVVSQPFLALWSSICLPSRCNKSVNSIPHLILLSTQSCFTSDSGEVVG